MWGGEENMTGKVSHILQPILSGLASLFKSYSIYPQGHPSVAKSLNKQKLLFEEYFLTHPRFELGVGPDRLFVDNEEILGFEWSDAIIEALHENSVSQAVFSRGLTEEHLFTFLEIVSIDPLVARKRGGYQRLLAQKGILTINISEIDYNLENRDDEAEDRKSDIDIWKKFIYGKENKYDEIEDEELVLLNELIKNVPKLAIILDTAIAGSAGKEEAQNAADVFFHIIGILQKEKAEMGDQPLLESFGLQVKKIMTVISPKSRYVLMQRSALPGKGNDSYDKKLIDLIFDINDRSLAQGILEGLNPANATPREFRRTFDSFIKTEKEAPVLAELSNIIRDRDIHHDMAFFNMMEQVERLPRNHQRLSRLAEVFKGAFESQAKREEPLYSLIEEGLTDITDLLETLSDQKVESASFVNWFAVLEMMKGKDNYEFYAQELHEEIIGLVHSGRYRLAAKAVKLLRKHARKSNDHDVSKVVSRKIIFAIRKEELARELLQAISQWGKRESKAIGDILKTLGTIAHGPTLEVLCEEQNRAARAVMIDILAKGNDDICDKCIENLDDSKWYVVRNMIILLSRLKPDDLVECMKKIYNHPDYRVRKETARALTVTKDREAVSLLVKLINDNDPSVYSQAVLSLGRFQGSSTAAKAIVDKLSNKKPFNGSREVEILAIQSLGKIKVPFALQTLENYISGPGILKGYDQGLIRSAVKSISAIDAPGSLSILVKGAKSWNKVVRQACQEVI